MFVLLTKEYEVLGEAVATMIANVIFVIYFVIIYRKVREESVLTLPRRIEPIGRQYTASLYSVGILAVFSIILFDLVTIVTNRLTVIYGDIPLAAMGIVIKLERFPINIGLGICMGMMSLVEINFSSGNLIRMDRISSLVKETLFSAL